MSDLIKRLEALDAPCGKLFYEAFIAIHGPKPPRLAGYSKEQSDWFNLRYTFSKMICVGAWQDATMTLLPEGDFDQDWTRSTRGKSEGFKLWQVRIALKTVDQDPKELGPVALGEHDIPAIAVLIAILRAQEASHDGQ